MRPADAGWSGFPRRRSSSARTCPASKVSPGGSGVAALGAGPRSSREDFSPAHGAAEAHRRHALHVGRRANADRDRGRSRGASADSAPCAALAIGASWPSLPHPGRAARNFARSTTGAAGILLYSPEIEYFDSAKSNAMAPSSTTTAARAPLRKSESIWLSESGVIDSMIRWANGAISMVTTFRFVYRLGINACLLPPPSPPRYWNHGVGLWKTSRSLIAKDLYESIPK